MRTAGAQQIGGREGPKSSALSVTACLRCRDQKLKCGREHPKCTRCSRLNTTCLYPEPPNRRGQRTKRRQVQGPAERNRHGYDLGNVAIQHARLESISYGTSAIGDYTSGLHPASGPSFSNSLSSTPNPGHNTVAFGPANIGDASPTLAGDAFVLSSSYAAQLRRMKSAVTDPTFNAERYALPPTAIGLALLEIYFARIYNASLLFYKPLLFQQYLEGRVHDALLRALFALATLFLCPGYNGSKYLKNCNEELNLLSVYYTCGLPWAKAALREAMPLAVERPSLMIVQALQCLQMYWFGIGESLSGNLCLVLAYRSCQILEFDRKTATEDHESGRSVEFELRRRCFWACWVSTCIVMEPESCIESAWREVAMLPLPCSLSSSLSGGEITFNQMMDEDWNSLAVHSSTGNTGLPTATGLLIKIVGAWAKVQLLCKNRATVAAGDVKPIHDLCSLTSSLFERAIAIRNSTRANDETPQMQMIFLLHNAIYHQSQITLHSMVVPLFSGDPTSSKIDPQAQRKSAEAVIRHAELFETLLEPYLYGRSDVSRLPPLVGYGAFIVAIVFLSAEVCWHNEPVSELRAGAGKKNRRLDAAVAILHLLDTLKIYWRALGNPWEILRAVLRKIQSTRIETSEPTEPREGQSSSHPEDCHTTTEAGASNEPSGLENGYQQPATTNRSTREGIEDRETSPTGYISGNASEGQADIIPSNSLMHQLDTFPEGEWYSLSFTGSGVEELGGMDISSLFQQGFGTFS
ncbi:hypothetical protein FOVG_18527 [Fusarium oxysporum f. sp. pisi HDV247]|uniref:Zn(2)-C6 fungal-type domain-containing protein n=2 Tax=Fusarium oxysporum f. sp. pisi HDV247 TaxID=1080344 RepID=W9NQF8_FUSOX|nr:hypothetical protein FOVG_18527 [Fusarium oxysporum f. sp. pisi HDV247]